MNWHDDRLQQYGRIRSVLGKPTEADAQLTLLPELHGVIDLALPITAIQVAPVGSLLAPKNESFIVADTLDFSGVVGLDSHILAVGTPGIWHLSFHKTFSFTGTTNLAKSQVIALTTISNDLQVTLGPVNLHKYLFVTGSLRELIFDFWLNMLESWSLTSITTGTVAGDELHSHTRLVARRFL